MKEYLVTSLSHSFSFIEVDTERFIVDRLYFPFHLPMERRSEGQAEKRRVFEGGKESCIKGEMLAVKGEGWEGSIISPEPFV